MLPEFPEWPIIRQDGSWQLVALIHLGDCGIWNNRYGGIFVESET